MNVVGVACALDGPHGHDLPVALRGLSERLKLALHRGTDLFAAVLEKNKTEATLVSFLKNITYYALLAAVVIASLNQLGVNTASFLTVISAAGLAIGLALKDSLGHFSTGGPGSCSSSFAPSRGVIR